MRVCENSFLRSHQTLFLQLDNSCARSIITNYNESLLVLQVLLNIFMSENKNVTKAAGDLERIKSKGLRFPSRHHSVIDHRDKIFYARMLEYLEQGDAVVFVGAPHVRGVSKLLRADGYQITR